MKIQIGKIAMNKTKRYLVPCLKAYGQEFSDRIGGVWKVAIGIGDIVTIKSNLIFEKHIFILLEAKTDKAHLSRFLKWIREQEMFEDDYAFDHCQRGFLHMLIIKLPESCYETYEAFKRGEYSKMYTPESLKSFFDKESDTFKILIKDHNYKFTFSAMLRKEYNVNIPINEITEDFEFEFPIEEKEEVFNIELK